MSPLARDHRVPVRAHVHRCEKHTWHDAASVRAHRMLKAGAVEGVCLIVDVDPERIKRRIETRYCDFMTDNMEEAVVA